MFRGGLSISVGGYDLVPFITCGGCEGCCDGVVRDFFLFEVSCLDWSVKNFDDVSSSCCETRSLAMRL